MSDLTEIVETEDGIQGIAVSGCNMLTCAEICKDRFNIEGNKGTCDNECPIQCAVEKLHYYETHNMIGQSKQVLQYQRTNYDCGAQSYLNALSYLYQRDEIPPDFIKAIYQYTLDEYDKEAYHGGTSPEAMRFISSWLNMYAKQKGYPIQCTHLNNYNMNHSAQIYKWIKAGGVAIVRVQCKKSAHYILITGIDEQYAYIFDSYLDESEIVYNRDYNIRVLLNNMNDSTTTDYYIGEESFQNAFLIKRTDTENSI